MLILRATGHQKGFAALLASFWLLSRDKYLTQAAIAAIRAGMPTNVMARRRL